MIPIFENNRPSHPQFSALDRKFSGRLSQLIRSREFSGKEGEFLDVYGYGKNALKRIMLVGLGNAATVTTERWRKLAGNLGRRAKAGKITMAALWLPQFSKISPEELGEAVAAGATMGAYQFDEYKSEPRKSVLRRFSISLPSRKGIAGIREGLSKGLVTGEAVNFARDLANLPANDLTPKMFVEKAIEKLKLEKSLKFEVIDVKRAKALKMGAFLGVGQGSENEPCILVIRYTGNRTSQKITGFVGKGVTFDTGGISIKPAARMGDMKADMSGAAAVLSATLALAKMKARTNLLTVIPLAENMPSGSAQRPGDIVRAMNGKSIEITNTDAEGRLILADALCYAVTQGATEIVDVATLTGAVSVAIGDVAIGLMGNDNRVIRDLEKSADQSGERVWELPLYDEYFDYLQSDVADMVNSSEGRLAGSSVGGKFLQQFVGKTPWAHLDIASTMSHSKTSGYAVKGMAGAGVRLLISFGRRG